jgi:hypothetical protein
LKIKFHRYDSVNQMPFSTGGYWWWDKPENKGTLHVAVIKASNWRFEAAVWCHELVEVLYCWIFGITTEEADRFDQIYEDGYKNGSIPITNDAGCDRRCPYYWGHMAGICMEYIVIYATFSSWKKYDHEYYNLMSGIE